MAINKSVMKHAFSMIPQANIQRSSFDRTHGYKTTFNAGYLIPFYVDEVLPGDTFNMHSQFFARLSTPITPFMDNLTMDVFYFFVPNRLVWDNWQKFNGEQENPGDSTDYLIPQLAPTTGYSTQTIFDYMGLPVGVPNITPSALPLRAYNLIYNQWFRDQNLIDSLPVPKDDGPDPLSNYHLQLRGKRHDYFTSCLPWPQKGEAVTIPIGESANVTFGSDDSNLVMPAFHWGLGFRATSGTAPPTPPYSPILSNAGFDRYSPYNPRVYLSANGAIDSDIPSGNVTTQLLNTPQNNYINDRFHAESGNGAFVTGSPGAQSQLTRLWLDGTSLGARADLTTAGAVTINALREAVQLQRLLERDARGGTRYTEILRAHFGVVSPDARLQRPEYLGGGSAPVNVHAVAQTSSTDSVTPQGNLAAFGVLSKHVNGFSKSFVEHGFIIGMFCVRADLTYQQGLNRMWSRRTRFDHYWPALAHLGEQAVLNQEIYAQGNAHDQEVFGYQERWAEYRYRPSQITGKFRSSDPQTLDMWHLSQYFLNLPTLSQTFIQEHVPLDRVLAVTNEPQFLMDSYHSLRCVRPMPLYSVPGLVDHF